MEEFYLEDPAEPSTSEAAEAKPARAEVRSPSRILQDKIAVAEKTKVLLKQKGDLIALEAKLAALDAENDNMRKEYNAAIDAIEGGETLGRPEVTARVQNGGVNTTGEYFKPW